MELITITPDNLDQEHICCAISSKKDDVQVCAKKAWMAERFADGLVFRKGDVRGKCFIEYLPAENAWAPIWAEGYLYIDCLWVSGRLKGQGYSNLLLESCIHDGKEAGKKGLVTLSSPKKLGFLSDPKYLQYKGFRLADTAAPYFELLYLPFKDKQEAPRFRDQVKHPEIDETGMTLFYTSQCPFTAKYIPLLQSVASDNNVLLRCIHIETKEQAQNSPCPFTTFALFDRGKFVTHEILSEKKFQKIITERRGGL